jgi:sugar lactone lactonase YvrE
MWNPQSAASDAAGNLYIADSQNNAIRMILRSNGWITTIAGLGPEKPGYSGDNGPATAAKLDSPQGVAIDSDGNIYISDNGNHVIRKITGGIISTIAGTGSTGYSGDGGPALSATFSTLKGLATDKQNNLYIADASNNVIRMIDRTGNIYTVAGDGIAGYSGDGGVANKARLSNPLSIAIDNQNNLYIADTNNSAIRKVTW